MTWTICPPFDTNPSNPFLVEQKSEGPTQKKRGWVWPGYKYLGPGNSLDKGEPVNALDAAARLHDIGYSRLQEKGVNPYLLYSSVDADFQSAIQTDKSFEGNLARGLFQLKRRLFPHTGVVPEDLGNQAGVQAAGAGATSGTVEGLPASSSAKVSKRRGDLGGRGRGGKRRKISMAAEAGATNADPPGASLGAGATNAPDGWHNSARWGDGTVTTAATRVWVLPSYDNHLYKKISESTDSAGADRFLGWSTPWGYFDFNRFHIFWSPRNWQRLVNSYTGFKPLSLRVKIHQIQIKEVTVQNATTQIATSLSSTVQVLADEGGVLPYVMASANVGTLSSFPNDVTILPQYAYTTLHYKGKGTGESSFFCLEGMDSVLLKTGDEISFEYHFPDLPFHSMFQVGQYLHQQGNPLLDQYLMICTGTDGQGLPTYARGPAKKYSKQYKNYLYGPAVQFNLLATDDDKAKLYNKKQLTQEQWEGTNPRTWVHDLGWNNMKPGPAMWGSEAGVEPVNAQVLFDNSTGRTTGQLPREPYRAEETELTYSNAPSNRTPAQLDNNVATQGASEANKVTQSVNTTGENTVLHERGLLPGMAWMDRDVYLCGPIWGKIPHTDGNIHPTPLIGGFGVKTPPPMILIKNTPVPANPTQFSDNIFRSYLTEYSTGLITLEMTWAVERSPVPRWNPDLQFTYATSMAEADWFWPNATGTYHEGMPVGTRWQTNHL
ncbi:capsid protein 1 [Desmodus rotundus dependoparvovirus]|uniref:Capsid protein 1 n=1 Tax=Desmodus rotundus dependoparvovirus TaxID=2137542 RepID=A0A2Z3D964_9VIRU|nr:capsid protein 1 [Desmodus rotundus dependoparvovirus]AVR53759.1 capsid protein 1 [Desmodus rotundus dependoparvovirus]